MKKILALIVVVPALLVGGLFLFVLYEGPRMTVQHHIREFQMSLPNIPAGTVPVQAPDRLPAAGRAALVKNPLAKTASTVARGQVYYQYYCVFCHGDSGAGDGPVGQSYIPKPADLRTARVAAYGDGELLRAMLTGIGHDDVMKRVVPPEHRWYLVLYLRSLAGA